VLEADNEADILIAAIAATKNLLAATKRVPNHYTVGPNIISPHPPAL
jgi:hypothetical protein